MSLRMTRGQIERRQRVEQVKYGVWRQQAAAMLERKHGITASIPEKIWRNAFIREATPEQAADEAERHHWNSRPPKFRMGK